MRDMGGGDLRKLKIMGSQSELLLVEGKANHFAALPPLCHDLKGYLAFFRVTVFVGFRQDGLFLINRVIRGAISALNRLPLKTP